MTYPDFFEKLTGQRPHPFQERLAGMLLEGKSVILRAPTGAGKTWATVAPFLYSLFDSQPLADRLLYALPLRSLAASLHTTVLHGMVAPPSLFGAVLSIGKDRDYRCSARYCSLQIGGQKDDPFLESDLVFTTIDQLLSSYLLTPVSLPNRLGNINAGALIGSFLVFDELHLLDPEVALGTTIEMLDRLRGLSQFVLMTATMSEIGIQWLARKLGAESFPLSDAEIRELPSQKTKQRTWTWAGQPLTSAVIQQAHQGGRTAVLVNTVTRAQELFQEIDAAYKDTATRRLLLHARYYPQDRKAVEDQLAGYFGPESNRSDVILVTTQVVEAGIDISADHLHTELAPMNALIQRAGRTARYPHRNTGTVAIYDVDRLGPYRGQRVLVEETKRLLQRLPQNGTPADYAQEQSWIDEVHGATEMKDLAAYEVLKQRRDDAHRIMDTGDRSLLPRLVRDLDLVNVVVADLPENLNFTGREFNGRRIGWPRMLSVPGISLLRPLQSCFENLAAEQWVAKSAEPREDEDPGLRFNWSEVRFAKELPFQWLIVIHPDFAIYDDRLGLVLGQGGPAPAITYSELPPVPRYQYEFEPWVDHAHRIVSQSRSMNGTSKRATEALARAVGATSEFIEELVRLTCLLHDTGKLAAGWQEAAWRWQRDKDARLRKAGAHLADRPRVPVAHTTFNPVIDASAQNRPEFRLPPHSVEGAYAVTGTVGRLLSTAGEDVAMLAVLSVISAIARHHGPRTSQMSLFTFESRADSLVRGLLPFKCEEGKLDTCLDKLAATQFGDMLVRFQRQGDAEAWALYCFLVRQLRLADQDALSTPATCSS